jgi:IMP dehydrogenase
VYAEQDTPVHEILRLLKDYRLSGLPIVDDAQRVIGMVHLRELEVSDDAPDVMAVAVMTRDVICVDEGESLSDAAWLLVQRGLDVLPVVRDGRLTGLLARADLVRLYAMVG